MKIIVRIFLVCIFPLIQSCNIPLEISISEYGALGDSLTINTSAIQNAIDDCSKKGGGTVLVSDGVYISGTIVLKNNVTLHVQENAKLVGSSNPLDYKSIDTFVDATGQERGTCLIGAVNATNIAITGEGTIDGNGKAFLAKNLISTFHKLGLNEDKTKEFGSNRPFLLRFVRSSQIQIQDINIRQAAAWACHFYQSHDIVIDNMSIYNHAHRNNDGIDLDSSYNVKITNCDINAGDDAICIKSTSPFPTYNVNVSGCKLKSDWGAIKFGTESMGDFYNISIKDCEIYDTKGGGIKLLSVDGANMHNVLIEDIVMENVDMPLFVRLGERLRTYRGADKQEVGTIKNIAIKNITATTRNMQNSRVSPPTGIFLTGTPNNKIESIELENIRIKLPGSATEIDLLPVEEMETSYPEFSFFKVLPAYGMFARHIDSLKVKNVKFEVLQPDFREEIVTKDITNKEIK